MDNQQNNLPVVQYQQPVVIKEHKDTSKEVAAIIAAASKLEQRLSLVEFWERISKLDLTMKHVIGIPTAIGGMVAFLVYAFANDTFDIFNLSLVAVRVPLFSGFMFWIVSFVPMLWLAVVTQTSERRDTTEFAEQTQQGIGAAVAVQKTFRVEVKDKNSLRFVDLPQWFTDKELLALADMDETFSRINLQEYGICTQQQWPELRDSFIKAQLAEQNGRQYELTEEFFDLVRLVEN